MNTKKFISTGFLLICITVSMNANDIKSIQSKLDEATIFYRGAELKHSASATLLKGANELQITGLSSDIDPNSIKIKSTDGVLISSYEFVDEWVYKNDIELIRKKISDSIKVYTDIIKLIDIETKVNEEMHDLFGKRMKQKILGLEKDSTQNKISLDELIKSVDYYKNKSIEAGTFLMKKKEEKELYQAEIDRLNERLTSDENEKENIKSLKLNVMASDAKTSQFIISYCTYSAGWSPFYNINVASIGKPIQIISKAKVFQTTGIEWKQVRLTLSTGSPSRGRVAPLFRTWFLQNIQAIVNHDIQAMQNSYTYSASKKIREMEIEELNQNTIEDYLTVNDNQLMTTYKIDLPYTIPGDGKEQSIDLRTQEANADYQFYCAPKLDNESYLLAEIKDSEKLDLPRGKAQITYDGMHIGETVIEGSSTLKDLTLTLGTDSRVTVKREKLHDFSSTKTFGSDIKQVLTYKITVKNNQSKAVKMVVKDQYPTSTQKGIEVELLKETTKPTFNKTETGVLSWEETLAPGETKTYQISYSVKYPKEMNLNL